MKASIYDIAESAGVSTSTVSRVFNRKQLISKEVEKKVLRIAKQMGYSPQQSAMKENIIVMIDNESMIRRPYIINFISALITVVSKYRVPLEIIPLDDIDFSLNNMKNMIIALLTSSNENHTKIKNINYKKLITINKSYDNFPSIWSNNMQGMDLAVSYLRKMGHKKIALIQRVGHSIEKKQRIDGFIKAMHKHGGDYDEQLIQPHLEQSCLETIMNKNATALICAGDHMTIQQINIFHRMRLSIPEDLSVLGYENRFISSETDPPQTTIMQDFESMAEMIYHYFQKGQINPEDTLYTDYRLIERSSVKKIN